MVLAVAEIPIAHIDRDPAAEPLETTDWSLDPSLAGSKSANAPACENVSQTLNAIGQDRRHCRYHR